LKTKTVVNRGKRFNGRIVKTVLLGLLVLTVVLAAVSPAAAAPVTVNAPAWHTVARGETLFSIGRHYNVNPWAIASANALANPHRIYAGQRLYVPAGPAYSQSHVCGTNYTVQRGDTLFRIARIYGVDAWRIAGANGIYNLNRIWVGQRLFIPCS
jgi:LysM repeat protein